jgi:hypothetical protein
MYTAIAATPTPTSSHTTSTYGPIPYHFCARYPFPAVPAAAALFSGCKLRAALSDKKIVRPSERISPTDNVKGPTTAAVLEGLSAHSAALRLCSLAALLNSRRERSAGVTCLKSCEPSPPGRCLSSEHCGSVRLSESATQDGEAGVRVRRDGGMPPHWST